MRPLRSTHAAQLGVRSDGRAARSRACGGPWRKRTGSAAQALGATARPAGARARAPRAPVRCARNATVMSSRCAQLELQRHEPVDRVDVEASGDEHGHRHRDAERGQHEAQRPALDLAQHHARRLTEQPARPACDRRACGGRRRAAPAASLRPAASRITARTADRARRPRAASRPLADRRSPRRARRAGSSSDGKWKYRL